MLEYNYQEMCELCDHLDASHLLEVWINLYGHIMDLWSTFLARKLNLNFEVEGPDTGQFVTGKDPREWLVILILLDFASTALENLLCGMVRWVWPCGRSKSTIWSDCHVTSAVYQWPSLSQCLSLQDNRPKPQTRYQRSHPY